MSVYILGSLNSDMLVMSDAFPRKGETFLGKSYTTLQGGKGANQAVAVSRADAKSIMIGAVGDDSNGKSLLKSLKESSVNIENVHITESPTGMAVINSVNGDNSIIVIPGANHQIKFDYIDEALNSAEANDFLVCQLECNIDAIEYALKKAKQKGLTTVVNAAPAIFLSDDILGNIDIFNVNETEFEFYTGIYPDSNENIKDGFNILLSFGIKNVLLSLGENGAIYLKDNSSIFVPSFKINPKDTTAAGDTLVGYFIANLSKNMDDKSSLELAVKASTITCLSLGAQNSIPNMENINNFDFNKFKRGEFKFK